ncbi:hypothetical protein QQ045_010046 [Rhodiola kirilowii]
MLEGLRKRENRERAMKDKRAALPASGCHFTWSNNHTNPPDRIWSKLDRALGNSMWFDEMEEDQAKFLSLGISDHSLVIVYWGQEARINKSFRYCNFWENLDDYDDIISNTWRCGSKCLNMFMIQAKMKTMKHIMKQSLVGRTRGMEKKVHQAREALLEAQRKSECNPNDDVYCAAERKLAKEFRKIKYNQFLFNKQRTKAHWIKEGDANTKFFHSLLKTRRTQNNIIQVTQADGTVPTDSLIIKQEFTNYFKGLLGQARVCNRIEGGVIAQGPTVNSIHCRSLVREATDNEIWAALNSIGSDKAPGPYDFSSSFFKRNWGILGKEICDGVRHCLRHNALPNGMNATNITLIPKSSQACRPEDYRPISCCNVTYKIVASLLAGRLKDILPDIVNPAQGAFVKDRSIVGNICLAQQLLNGYGRKNISERVAWKIDLWKAYDTIDWKFMESMLQNLKFPCKL